ncbi:MAG: hypothetical protein LBR77_03650 [Lachnospiraceae bacterium]|jgi:hypothetical protein|nr:hypothetical protein [Lachnospiraceae bacterium]
MYREEYDERQLKIRGDVYRRGWVFAVGLMLVNFYLNTFEGVVWAPPGSMFVLVSMASIAYVSIEMMVRDVFVGRDSWRLYVIPFCQLFFAFWLFFLSWPDRDYLVSGGMLTRSGVSLVNAVFFFLVGIVGVGKFIVKRRLETDEETTPAKAVDSKKR